MSSLPSTQATTTTASMLYYSDLAIQMDTPLSTLYHQALLVGEKAYKLPTIEDKTQELIRSAISDLQTVHIRVQNLSLFSPNETLIDISTRDLAYIFVPFILSELEDRVRTRDPHERLQRITRAQAYLREYLSSLETYEIIPEAEKQLFERRTTSISNPAERRELKIKQWKKEKELRQAIEEVRKRRNQTPSGEEPQSNPGLIASLLPSPSSKNDQDMEEEDLDTEDILREATLLLVRLTYVEAQSNLDNWNQELELLRNMPPPQPQSDDPRSSKAAGQDEVWKLDAPHPTGGPDGQGPLLDLKGKPLRPFTILPAGASNRARLQAQVFQADHRLPTMSIDEYLEIEQQRGNIISGGGPASENKPTTSEQLQLDSEMDGTVFGEEKGEEKRQKDESWAQYTDNHARGAGNTMNRG